MTWMYVALGAALAGPLRYAAGRLLDGRLPWGILLANLTGSFVLGYAVGAGLEGDAAALVGAGFCGGLTTWSTFALQTHDLGLRRGLLNVAITVPGALAACTLGYLLAR